MYFIHLSLLFFPEQKEQGNSCTSLTNRKKDSKQEKLSISALFTSPFLVLMCWAKHTSNATPLTHTAELHSASFQKPKQKYPGIQMIFEFCLCWAQGSGICQQGASLPQGTYLGRLPGSSSKRSRSSMLPQAHNFLHKPFLGLAKLLNGEKAKFWLKFSLRNHYFHISTWKCRNTWVFFRSTFLENCYRRPYQEFRINSCLWKSLL